MGKSMKAAGMLLCFILLALSGCRAKENQESSNEKKDIFSDSSQVILEQIIKESGMESGMTFDEPVTMENCNSILGLTSEDFEEHVEDAYVSVAAITAQAHLTAMVKCRDFERALLIKDLIANGFDSGRWICVFPDESFVVESGSYVFLASTTAENAEALKKGFESAAKDTAGEINVFYTGER